MAADLLKCDHCLQRTKMLSIIWVWGIFTKYAWVKPLRHEKDETVLNPFIKIVNESSQKQNKLWVNQGREF